MSNRDRKMDPEKRAVWLEALRSGHYKQTTERLRKGNCYCCLGVLLTVLELGRWQFDSERTGWDFYRADDEDAAPMYVDLDWETRNLLGMSVQDHQALQRANDSGRSFDEIALLIESGGLRSLIG